MYIGVSQNEGYHFEGLHNKDYNILGSIFGFPLFRETTIWGGGGGGGGD